jgi:hypothetical protein
VFDIAARPRLGHSRGMAIEIAEPPYRAGSPHDGAGRGRGAHDLTPRSEKEIP